MKFIGIDLAWTYKNETGLCVLDESGKVDYLDAKVYTDEDIVKIIESYSQDDLCIAVDAPLVLENETGAREADRLLAKARIHGQQVKLFMANRKFFIKHFKVIRGEVLAKKIKETLFGSTGQIAEFGYLAEKGKTTLVETFPTGICCGLFPEIYPVKYKVKGKVPYGQTNAELHKILNRICAVERLEGKVEGLLEHFDFEGQEITKKAHKHIEDKMDAFLSAYGLFTIYKGYAKPLSFGQIHDGFITVPLGGQVNRESSQAEDDGVEAYSYVRNHTASLVESSLQRNCEIVYEVGGPESLDTVKALWTQLNAHHASNSIHFKDAFNSFTFESRKGVLLSSNKQVMIVLAKDKVSQKTVGYSIASIEDKKKGEIDSIYLKPEYRGLGVGDVLMQEPLKWFEKRQIKRVILGVATGNEAVFPFYEKFGFYPKVTILEKK